jgi:aspartyl-tRNA(Asn)/glutamyl-tRNA(Gln) amidotransferase subunit C
MQLSRQDIEKLSLLARIELTEDEKEKYRKELTQVLDYVDQLSEVNTEGVVPIAHVTGLFQELREDVVQPTADPANLIALAPESADNQIKTKKVL